MTNLITTLPRYGDAGSIVDTRESYIIPVRYVTNLVTQTYTLNLNPISGSIINLGQYTLSVRGSMSTMVFSQGIGTPLLDLTSQLVSHINRFGYLWASISGSGIITLTSREPGIDNMVLLQGGLFGATLTQTVAPSNPPPLVAGTLVFWDATYSVTDPWASRKVTTYDIASVVGGFSVNRSIAGVICRDSRNYQTSDLITGKEIEIMRGGNIWVRNYGGTIINRNTVPTINTAAGTSLVPSGAFGVSGLALDLPFQLQYQSIARPNETAILGINLA